MQIEIALINDRLHLLKVSQKFRIPTIFTFAAILQVKFAIFLKNNVLFNNFYCFFCL